MMLHHGQVCFPRASHFATLNNKKNWDLTKLAFCNASSRIILAEAGIFLILQVCGSGEYPDCRYSGRLCLSSCQGTGVLPAVIFAWSVQNQHRGKKKKEKTNNILVSLWKLFLTASMPWKWPLLVCGQYLQTAEANIARDYENRW